MEEFELLKERLQFITEKHRIQESIRQKKLELDQEKLELQRLKKKVLKEQWLLQDSVSHNASDGVLGDQQQTRALQLRIHKTELEVDYLERQESMVSVNESFVLNRLKTVERSPEDIIKEAQNNFVPDQVQVATDDVFSPSGRSQSEPNQTRFSPEITVTTAETPEDIEHVGLQLFHDQTNWIHAFGPHEDSGDQELSATEVEHLLRNVSEHHRLHQPNRGNPARAEGCGFNGQGGGVDGHWFGDGVSVGGAVQVECCRHWEVSHSSLEDRNNQRNQRHQGSRSRQHRHSKTKTDKDGQHSSLSMGTLPGTRSHGVASQDGVRRRSSGVPPPRWHQQRVLTADQPELCYTPEHHIPLDDYVTVDEEQLYGTARYRHASHRASAHSPLYGDDAPYTILSAVDTTEPVTAIFMGFQMATDDSGQTLGCEGALTAELVVIGDDPETCDGRPPTTRSANGKGVGGALRQNHGGAGIRKIQKKHKPCCRVC